MGKGKFPKANKNRQRVNRNKNERLPSTGGQDDRANKDLGYQDAHKSKVRTEQSGFDKVVGFLEQWGLILSLVVILIGAIFWASSLSFDVNKAKDDILKNEENIEIVKIKTNLADLKSVSISKDIEYIKNNNQRLDADVKALNMSVSEIIRKPN